MRKFLILIILSIQHSFNESSFEPLPVISNRFSALINNSFLIFSFLFFYQISDNSLFSWCSFIKLCLPINLFNSFQRANSFFLYVKITFVLLLNFFNFRLLFDNNIHFFYVLLLYFWVDRLFFALLVNWRSSVTNRLLKFGGKISILRSIRKAKW